MRAVRYTTRLQLRGLGPQLFPGWEDSTINAGPDVPMSASLGNPRLLILGTCWPFGPLAATVVLGRSRRSKFLAGAFAVMLPLFLFLLRGSPRMTRSVPDPYALGRELNPGLRQWSFNFWQPHQESNPNLLLRTERCLPLHHGAKSLWATKLVERRSFLAKRCSPSGIRPIS